MSNLVLELSTITFHQLSRLASLPAGAIVDYLVKGKSRSWSDLVMLAVSGVGMYVASSQGDDIAYSFIAACAALVYVGSYVAVAGLLNYVCHYFQVSTSEFVYLSSPWGFLSSCFWLLGTYLIRNTSDKSDPVEKQDDLSTVNVAFLVVVNGFLAVSVQWLSTWAAGSSSTTLYAVIGQAKTAATVFVGVIVFSTPLSLQTSLGLLTCVVAALALTLSEASERTPKSHRLKRTSDATFWIAITLLGVLLTHKLFLSTCIAYATPLKISSLLPSSVSERMVNSSTLAPS